MIIMNYQVLENRGIIHATTLVIGKAKPTWVLVPQHMGLMVFIDIGM